jgi:hypothetical protein
MFYNFAYKFIYYNGSFINALKDLYPETSWDPHRFSQGIPGTSNSTIDWKEVEQILQITKPEDWYKVTKDKLKSSPVARHFRYLNYCIV